MAKASYREGLRLWHEMQQVEQRLGIVKGLAGLAETAAAQGRAGRLFGAASRLLPSVHLPGGGAQTERCGSCASRCSDLRGMMGCRTDDDRGASHQFCVTRHLAEAMASFAYSNSYNWERSTIMTTQGSTPVLHETSSRCFVPATEPP